jgi:orotate phosphoribosyltransferase
MNAKVNKELCYFDELLSAFRPPSDDAIGRHLTDDEFIGYAANTLDSVVDEAIDAHLGTCSTCTGRMEHLLSESRPWTGNHGEQHVRAFGQALLDEFLGKSEVSDSKPFHENAIADDHRDRSNLRLRTQDELDVITLLQDLDVVERDYDYVLPSGLHSDTYVNTAKLCRSEEGLRQVARAFKDLFSDIPFDAVVSSGWAMGMIARRLARHVACCSNLHIQLAVAEGYSSLSFTEDILPGSRVLVLTDVSITGQLSSRLKKHIHRFDASVVAEGCIVSPSSFSHGRFEPMRTLARIDMMLNDPAQETCPRCATLRKLVFNPISSQMTVKKLEPRSPTQFLLEFPDAVTFWEAVNTAHAYEHHHIENDTHYIAFVDTAKMLRHAKVGPQIVSALLRLLTTNVTIPDIIILPDRNRARLLARALVDAMSKEQLGQPRQIVLAQRRSESWKIDDDVQGRLSGADVLILDTAAGHGCVLDELSLLATEAGAKSVSAAVLLSRLTLSNEEAFRHRLSGQFYRLFHLPIRPVATHTNDRSLCPVCHQRDLIQQAAAEKREAALVQLAEQAAKMTKWPRKTESVTTNTTRYSQQLLFPVPDPPLLNRCRRGVASGITLHALHTAMTDGMAPLALPELSSAEIPRENKVAMLENLPPGVFEWSGMFLDQSVEDVLVDGNEENVWLASADILAREGRSYWVPYLRSLLERSLDLQSKPHDTFWNRIAYGAFRLSHDDADLRGEIREMVQGLLDIYRNSAPGTGLHRVVEVLTDSGDDGPIGMKQEDQGSLV